MQEVKIVNIVSAMKANINILDFGISLGLDAGVCRSRYGSIAIA